MTYVGKDSIFALWKMGLLGHPLPFIEFVTQPSGRIAYSSSWPKGDLVTLDECTLSINIIGIEQAKLQKIIQKLIEGLYGEDVAKKYIHYYYNHVWLSSKTASKYLGMEAEGKAVKMSGRKGLYINVDTLLDKMRDKVLSVIRDNNPDLDEGEAWKIAERIAVASLKYLLLSVDRDKIVVFDLDDALDVTKESGAYILYSYARAKSILRKAEYDVPAEHGISYDLLNDYDKMLLRYLAITPVVILEAGKSLEVKPLVNYMYRLSQMFNEFYEKNPVLKAEEEVKASRLTIIRVYIVVMNLLSMLTGIPLVERM